MNKVYAGVVKDDLTDQDYMDMLAELRQTHTYRQLVDLLGSRYSPAYWSKIERGQAPLTSEARAELRAVFGRAVLPVRPTAQEAVAGVAPDAAILYVAADDAADVNRLILVGGSEYLSLFVNGSASGLRFAPDGGVTQAMRTHHTTEAKPSELGGSVRRTRRLVRPVASAHQEERRVSLSASWKEVIEAGLSSLERSSQCDKH